MKRRATLILFALLAAGCAPEAGQEVAETTETAEMPETQEYAAALAGLADEWETHLNMQHPEVVADLHTSDGVFSGAFGEFAKGREQIVAWLNGLVEGSPTITIETTAQRMAGDYGVARGTWQMAGTSPEGAAVTNNGHWIGLYEQVDGAWKLEWLYSNLGSQGQTYPPEVSGSGMTEPPVAMAGPLAGTADYYATHLNMGHGDMVAELYADDAVYMSAGYPMVSGKAAIQTTINERIAANAPQLTVTTTEERALGGGWHASRGSYSLSGTMEGQSMTQSGRYIIIAQEAADGSPKIKWILSNARAMM